jgi:hypothetical protein
MNLPAFNYLCNLTTNKPYIYFVRYDKYVKIGFSKNVISRYISLQNGQGGAIMPFTYMRESVNQDWELLYCFRSRQNVESALHRKLWHRKEAGEWFIYDNIIKRLIDFLKTIDKDRPYWDDWHKMRAIMSDERLQELEALNPQTYEAYVITQIQHFDAGSQLCPSQNALLDLAK